MDPVSFLAALICFNVFLEPGLETAMVFHPKAEITSTPASMDIKYEDIYIPTSEFVKIHGWYIKREGSDKVALILHGNAGNLSRSNKVLKTFYDLDYNILAIEYHGFGKSQGFPMEANLYQDVLAAYDYLRQTKNYQASQIIAVGRSLGGPVATYLATKRPLAGLVLISAPTSVPEMFDYLSSPLLRPFIWINAKFPTREMLPYINCPVLFIHGIKDNYVPYRMGQENFAVAKEPKKFITMDRGDHTHIYLQDVSPDIKEFLTKAPNH